MSAWMNDMHEYEKNDINILCMPLGYGALFWRNIAFNYNKVTCHDRFDIYYTVKANFESSYKISGLLKWQFFYFWGT